MDEDFVSESRGIAAQRSAFVLPAPSTIAPLELLLTVTVMPPEGTCPTAPTSQTREKPLRVECR
jgi:hypothetical protein